MVDSVKNYGIAGLSADIELGKAGAQIKGSVSGVISLMDTNDALEVASIGEGTGATHGVSKSQLSSITDPKVQWTKTSVSFNSGTVLVGTASSGTWIHEVSVQFDAAWTGANNTTDIIVGDAGDTNRLFTEFDPTIQTKSMPYYEYGSDTVVNAIVTQGGASAGTAVITILYSGTLE